MDLKLKAHIGDSLASLFARTLIMDLVLNKKILRLEKYFTHSSRMVSNHHFNRVVEKCELLGDISSFNHDYNAVATRYEAALYDIYIDRGFDAAFTFFKETAYKTYLEECIIMSPEGLITY